MSEPTERPRSFAALRHPHYRIYVTGAMLAMMADQIEHVISYWVIFQKFQSPALGGFAIFAHWVPFLLFSFYTGALADRFDPRRLIQIGMVLFMFVSLAWGILFATDTLQMWHAVVLLILHGISGVFWGPSAQLLIHDIVGRENLQSAVRTLAITRNFGSLMGPVIGGTLLFALGESLGIFINALFYLPLIVWLWRAPYGPKFRTGEQQPRKFPSLADMYGTFAKIGDNRIIIYMLFATAAAGFFVGNAHEPQLPEFARDFGIGEAGLFYAIMLAARSSGALTAGIVLESGGFLQPKQQTALTLVVIWALAIAAFAATPFYPLGIALLFVAGFMNLAFNSMAQTLVQLEAPPDIRGRVIGLYQTARSGMGAFSGLIVGYGGSLVGIHWSLGLSALLLMAVTFSLLTFSLRPAAR